jgi:hypothetical protein
MTMTNELKVDQRWQHGDHIHVITDVTSDGEVGYRVDGVPFTRNDAGEVMPQRHWTSAGNFTKDRTLVVPAPAAQVAMPPALVSTGRGKVKGGK